MSSQNLQHRTMTLLIPALLLLTRSTTAFGFTSHLSPLSDRIPLVLLNNDVNDRTNSRNRHYNNNNNNRFHDTPKNRFVALNAVVGTAEEEEKTDPAQEQTKKEETTTLTKKTEDNERLINDFCIGTNEFWKRLVIQPVKDYVEIQPAGTSGSDVLSKLTAPPEVPGISRPVWLTILGSVPTALGWYGYYKFSIEEELFQYEIQNGKPVTGCGGYGTLFPFVFGVIIGFPLSFLGIPGGESILQAAGAWILLGQVNLYRRVNELCTESMEEESTQLSEALEGEPPLHAWWALLPPPLDVVVGLRQVHFLSEFWRIERGEPYARDVIAEELFPFISSPRFTLKEFFRTPSNWFWFTKDWKDLEFEILKD